jgi:hypothetical protein
VQFVEALLGVLGAFVWPLGCATWHNGTTCCDDSHGSSSFEHCSCFWTWPIRMERICRYTSLGDFSRANTAFLEVLGRADCKIHCRVLLLWPRNSYQGWLHNWSLMGVLCSRRPFLPQWDVHVVSALSQTPSGCAWIGSTRTHHHNRFATIDSAVCAKNNHRVADPFNSNRSKQPNALHTDGRLHVWLGVVFYLLCCARYPRKC